MQPPDDRGARIKDRVELEKKFLSSVLAGIDDGDIREIAARYPGLSWRHFRDRRHQALWRAITTLDLTKNVEERVDALIAELPEEDRADLADNRGAIKALYKQAESRAWLRHEIAAAGALPMVGGKVYLQEVCDAWAAALSADSLAKRFMKALKISGGGADENITVYGRQT
jgi:hypothetical protein